MVKFRKRYYRLFRLAVARGFSSLQALTIIHDAMAGDRGAMSWARTVYYSRHGWLEEGI